MTITTGTMKAIRIVLGTALGAGLFLLQALPARAAMPKKAHDHFYEIYNSTSTSPAARLRAWSALRRAERNLPPPSFQITRPSTSTVAGLIVVGKGGRVARADKAAITVPSGALTSAVVITISSPTVRNFLEEAVKTRKMTSANLVAASDGVVFGPDGTTFRFAATVVLPYSAAYIQAQGLHDFDLQVYSWDPNKQKWDWLSSSVDPTSHTVSAQTLHLSLFRILGRPRH